MKKALTKLAATTGADQSDTFFVRQDEKVLVMCSPNMVSAEAAQIQITHDDGTTWVDANNGALLELTATTNHLVLDGPGVYRVDKEATVTATGIYVRV